MSIPITLCTICARGGSKGVPSKNIREIAGKPLIAHTIEQAKASNIFNIIAVSSDDSKILEVAKKYGADYLIERPAALASDTSAKSPAIRHCVEEVERLSGKEFDILVDLDATSPLRNINDINGAVELLISSKTGNVITGSQSHRSPYFNLVELNNIGNVELSKKLEQNIVRRQDAPVSFDMNASIYVWSRESFFEGPMVFRHDTKLYEMPAERSLDIDSEFDWLIVEFLMTKKYIKN